MGKISSFSMPNINYFGLNSSVKTASILKDFNSKNCLIITDVNLSSTGILDVIRYNLDEYKFKYSVWDGVHSNPTDIDVENGVKHFQKGHFDSIVALGGGSVIDCAKAIRVVADNGGKIKDYVGNDKVKISKIPLIAIATTAGSSSETNRFAVITSTENTTIKYKMGILDWKIIPNASINDPILTSSLNKFYTAGTGMDVFTHAIEAIMSVESSPFSDEMGFKAINLVSKWLKMAVEDGSNIEARTNMVYATLFAGIAFNTALLGITHSLTHPIVSYYDIHHGMCNAIILPEVCKFNFNESIDKLAKIAEAMGIDTSRMSLIEAANSTINGIRKLQSDINIPAKLGELGVDKSKIDDMAIDAYNDFYAKTNPRKANIDDFRNIYESII